MTSTTDQIVSLESFQPALQALEGADEKQAREIWLALSKATAETHEGIRGATHNPDLLRYWLYREAVEIKAHTSSYLSYSEMMATRESKLWRYALTVTDKFFEITFDAIDEYFDAKNKIMTRECEESSEWYSSLSDSSRKLLSPINYATKILQRAKDVVGVDVAIPEGDIFDTKGVVEAVLERHLAAERVAADIGEILEQASARFKEMWKREIQAQAPDLAELRAFASRASGSTDLAVKVELGIAEHAFTVGMAGAVVGTVGLAAGWHTLAYSMMHVFPPVAIFSVVAAVALAVATKERALDRRRKQIEETLNRYQQQILLQVDTQEIPELGGLTMRQAITEQSRQLVQETIERWQKAISGNLTTDHYRLLISSTVAHMRLVEQALRTLDASKV